MEIRYLNKGLLNDARILSSDLNNESNLFVVEDKILKILNKKHRTNDRKETVIKLGEYNNDECCLPEFLISESSKKEDFSGFGMTYYDEYTELIKLINTLTFKERFIIAKKLVLLIENFEDIKYTYVDIHFCNVLVKGTNIKLGDMDGGCYRSVVGNELYRMLLSSSYHELARYILALLYNIDCISYKEFFIKNLNVFKRNSNKNQFKMVVEATEDNGRIFHPSDFIDSFTEEYVSETSPKLAMIK
jgi:hypothetical protein